MTEAAGRGMVNLVLLLALPQYLTFHLASFAFNDILLKNVKNVRLLRVSPLHMKDSEQRPVQQCPSFFNRQAETELLIRRLHEDPVFSVVVGPPSCGKSALINHVLDQKLEGGRNAIHSIRIDLRGRDVSNKESLHYALLDQSRLAAITDKVWSSFSRKLTGAEFSLKNWKLILKPPQRYKEFDFDTLVSTIPKWPLGGDGRPYVLFIDEANELSALAANDEKVKSVGIA